MTDTIKIRPAEFAQQSEALEAALETFESYTTTFTKETRGALEGFNSDFIEGLKGVLKHINDDAGLETLAVIREYKDKVAALAQTFEATDDGIAASFEGGG